MLVLVMAPAISRKVPTVVAQKANDVSHFHVAKVGACFQSD
jgi:hypothetical protein